MRSFASLVGARGACWHLSAALWSEWSLKSIHTDPALSGSLSSHTIINDVTSTLQYPEIELTALLPDGCCR